ncbi:MAG TPA: putative metal-dependent hydrolase [Bryobacteraceae bacterium]|nr:putative metal-dependent hydrolase [Bryobacteraceae bacterium]
MTNQPAPDLSYPIGRFQAPPQATPEQIQTATEEIAALPAQIEQVLSQLTPAQLESTYRPGGWTGLQVLTHLADSHMHAYIRIKFALTQDRPVIMPYGQDAWASFEDAKSGDPKDSLEILRGVHSRMAVTLRGLKAEDWSREFVHPELGPRTVGMTALLYAWHGKHHLGHLKLLASS